MKLFLCYNINRKTFSDKFVTYKFYNLVVERKISLVSNYSYSFGSVLKRDLFNRTSSFNSSLIRNSITTKSDNINYHVDWYGKTYKLYCDPLSMTFTFNRYFKTSCPLLPNLSAKADAKSDTKINPVVAPAPVPPPSPSMPPPHYTHQTSMPPLSSTTPPMPPPTGPNYTTEESIRHEDVNRSITLAKLTEVNKHHVTDLNKALKVDDNVKKKSILKTVTDELKHYYHGFRLLFIDIRVSASLVFHVLRGHTLRRREKQLLRRVVGDVFRLLPFTVFLVIPFMELTLPIFLKLFPNMLPSTFQTTAEKENKLRRKVKVKLEMTKFLQETLSDIAVAGKTNCVQCAQDAKEFADFFQKVRSGKGVPTNEEILKFSHLFTDRITLDTLPRPQLVALCRVLDIKPFGTTAFLRFQIDLRLRSIRADDKVIMKEGVDSLDLLELQQACQARGMRALGVSEEYLRSHLKQWIELTRNSKVPETLLLLSRAFMYHDDEDRGTSQAAAAQHIAEAISALPETAGIMAKDKVDTVQGVADPKQEIELIREQFKMIKEERKEEMAEKARLETAEKEIEPPTKVDDNKQPYPFIKGEPVEVDGLLICRPVSKLDPDMITSDDAKAIQIAVEQLSKEIFTLEKEELGKLKDKLEDYKQDFNLLEESPDGKIQESKAAKRLYKFTRNLAEKLEKSIKDLDEKQDSKKIDGTPQDSVNIRKKLLRIDELVTVIRGLQKVSGGSNQRLKSITDVLSRMAIDSNTETIRLETLLKVINLLQKESVNLTTEQMDELIEMIKKEEFISLHDQIEKNLQNQGNIDTNIKNVQFTTPLNVQPTQTPPLNVQPTQTPPLSVQPKQTPPLNVQPTQTPPLNVQPTQTPSLNVQPTQTPPLNVQPTQTPPLNVQPTQTPPLNVQPTQTPPLNVQPTQTPPLNVQPTQTPPLNAQSPPLNAQSPPLKQPPPPNEQHKEPLPLNENKKPSK